MPCAALQISAISQEMHVSIQAESSVLLIASGFVRISNYYGRKKKDALFQLADYYTTFYLRFIKDNYGKEEHLWSNTKDNPEWLERFGEYSFPLIPQAVKNEMRNQRRCCRWQYFGNTHGAMATIIETKELRCLK